MIAVLAFILGYFLGVRTDRRDLEPLRRSVLALYGTDEFADVVTAARAQVADTLRSLAVVAEGNSADRGSDSDLVERVKHLVGQD